MVHNRGGSTGFSVLNVRVKLAALAVAVLAFVPAGASAQRAVFVGENDGLVPYSDRDYTGGFRASLVFDDLKGTLAGGFFGFVSPALITAGAPAGPVRQQVEWIYFGESIFTPSRPTSPVRAPGDRPFGGWLYNGFSISQESNRQQLDTFEVLAGVVGPAAQGAEIQGLIHRIIGQPPPVVNNYQIQNEPGVAVSWERRWKFGTEFGDRFGFDVIPSVGVTAGNVFTYASAGAVARIGRSLGTTWGPTLVRPSVSGASFISPDPQGPYFGFDFFAGVEGRAVARNIFLDGNSFVSSPRVTKNPFVFDLVAGAELFTQTGHRLAFTVVRRSPEYTTQGAASIFASAEASVKF